MTSDCTMSGIESFTIQLDRANGIYHGGEVVRGKVKLITTKAIKSRSVRVRFQGVGQMRFISGAGESELHYYGAKTFQEQHHTMFGNYYNTADIGLVRGDAIFGGADGDGIMYIPCNEDEDLSLVVRVVRDSLIGEILLDVNQLIARGKATNFPLKKKGSHASTKAEITLSAEIMPLRSVFPVSTCRNARFADDVCSRGRKYDSVCQLRVHKVADLRGHGFHQNNDVHVQAYRAPDCVDESKALPNPSVSTVLPAGTLEFPFSFTLRTDAPGSAELNGDEIRAEGCIRYSLYATIDTAKRGPSVRHVFTVLPRRPLPTPMLLRSVEYKCLQPIQLSACCLCPCLPCFNIGDIFVDAKLGRQAFAPGETVDFHVRVINNTAEKLHMNIVLVCKVHLQVPTMPVNGSEWFETNHLMLCDTVQPHARLELGHETAGAGDYKEKSRVLVIPAVFPSFHGARGQTSALHEAVTFVYCVEFQVATTGMCSTAQSVSFPVLICAAPPSASAVQTARPQTPVQQSKQHGDHTYLLQGIIADDASGAVDIDSSNSQLVPVGAPVVTRCDDRHSDEDAAAVVYAPKYQAYALTYTSTATALPSTELSSVVEVDEAVVVELGEDSFFDRVVGGYTAVAPVAPLAPFAAASMDRSVGPSEEPVTSLIESLCSSEDLRVTVRAWVVSTTTSSSASAVHDLSPESLQRVLQSVSISSDQLVVARELASTIHCTCAHVAAALTACQFYQTEMAAAMVPFVQDVENKAQVLNMLPSYDQMKVEVLFV